MNQGCGGKIESPWPKWPPSLRQYYPCCTIINEDWRRHLFDGRLPKFDLIIADPPYGMNVEGWQDHHDKVDWDATFPSLDLTKLLELSRIAAYYFCRWDNLWDHEGRAPLVLPATLSEYRRMAETGTPPDHVVVINNLPKPKSTLIWHKVGSGGGGLGDLNHEHGRDYETALFYPGPDHKFKMRPPSVLTCERAGNDAHPTEKPVELLKEIMTWYEFETVLDPYMGSGATAVAAKELGKHFLGFERNETFYKRAVQRISETPSPARQ